MFGISPSSFSLMRAKSLGGYLSRGFQFKCYCEMRIYMVSYLERDPVITVGSSNEKYKKSSRLKNFLSPFCGFFPV